MYDKGFEDSIEFCLWSGSGMPTAVGLEALAHMFNDRGQAIQADDAWRFAVYLRQRKLH